MARIFIFGATGMLGSTLSQYLGSKGYETTSFSRDQFNPLTGSLEVLQAEYAFTSADVLINAMGVTNRYLKTIPGEVFYKVNAEFPKALDVLVGSTGSVLVHFSSESVFSNDGVCTEETEPNPDETYGVYAASKLAGDQLSRAVILRLSPIGIEQYHHHNLISWVLAHEGQTVQGYTNHLWNGLTTLTIAEIVERFVRDGFPAHGLYHLFSDRIVTKYELLGLIARAFDVRITIEPCEAERAVPRYLGTVRELNDSLSIPPIEQQLEALRTYCDKHNIKWKST